MRCRDGRPQTSGRNVCPQRCLGPRRLSLDRKGLDLTSCGDSDLAFTAIDMGLGTGQFTCLNLRHLIPEARLSEPYLLNLVEKMSYSLAILNSLRERLPASSQKGCLGRRLDWLRLIFMARRDRKFELARRRGVATALNALNAQRNPPAPGHSLV